jgi:alkanesulfonate monooxygenase SsuD/methylene tetrahydromethanopterin reductase-like flavin-dependent oxidoreductase (luciferase family)
MGFCLSVAHATSRMTIGTAILPIYLRRADELANAAAHLHEVSHGRFRLGLGVSHDHLQERLGLSRPSPLSDIRSFVAALHAAESPQADGRGAQARGAGPMPPIVLATLRDRMVHLAVEVADGAIWANGTRDGIAAVAPGIREAKGDAFVVANMVFTVVDDDVEAARALNRSHLARYASVRNYRRYWKATGYEDEMVAVEAALEETGTPDLAPLISDRLLDDVTLSGPAAVVRDGVDAWRAAGVDDVVLVPSSTSGGQFQAIRELFEAFA